MRHPLVVVLCVAIVPPILSAEAASADMKAIYVGGTLDSVRPGLHGRLDLQGAKELLFRYTKAQSLRIPYSGVTEIAVGDAGSRIAPSRAAMGAALGLPGVLLMAKMGKKSKNYLTISYQ